MMRQPVQQCCCQLGIAKYGCLFREAKVGGDDEAGLLIELAEKMEQQSTADLAERQVAELIKDDEIDMCEPVGHTSLLADELLLFEGIDQFDG